MRHLEDGDVVKMACHNCQAFQECRFSYGPYEHEGSVVEDVFRGVCSVCGSITGIHARSTYRLAGARKKVQGRRTSVSLPAEMQDMIASELVRCGSDWSHAELFFRALLVTCHENPEEIGRLIADAKSHVASPGRSILNLRLGKSLSETLNRVSQASKVNNTSEVIRRLVCVATDGPIANPFRKELRSLALAYA